MCSVEKIVTIIDVWGVFVFSISGALNAMSKKLDPFGVFIIAFITSVGGGTLRDVLMGRTVFWMEDHMYIYIISAGTIVSIILRKKITYLMKTLSLFDTLGLAIFTVIGIEVGLKYDLSPSVAIALGAMTGSFGGVIRDISLNEIPLIFQKEIYATASIAGGLIYMLGLEIGLEKPIVELVAIAFIIVVRLIVVKYELQLPSFYDKEEVEKEV
ncbi:MAG: trimeric intracellular cation channel family protein [Ichthyobacteriaceae bacterium]|nr:trimeric intracellular cation channel family protein [Ichthyobacteriaceae bacterium]